jgi:hypothetical protein
MNAASVSGEFGGWDEQVDREFDLNEGYICRLSTGQKMMMNCGHSRSGHHAIRLSVAELKGDRTMTDIRSLERTLLDNLLRKVIKLLPCSQICRMTI